MPKFPPARYALEAAAVAVNHGVEDGYILRVDGRLVAVMVRLDADYNSVFQGQWYLEAGFGACSGIPPATMPRLRDLLSWVADRLGDDRRVVDEALRDDGQA